MSSEPSRMPSRTSTRVVMGAVVLVAVIVAAIAVVVAVAGGSSDSDTDANAAQSSGSPTVTGSPSQPALPSSKPRNVWARWVEYHIVVGGKRVPGSWESVTSQGHTWLATKEDGRSDTVWGTGRHAHELADSGCCQVELSFNGRWIAYATSNSAGFLRLVDATTGRMRELRVPADYGWGVEGVTNDGVVLLWGCDNRNPICPGVTTSATITRHIWVPDSGRLIDVRHYTGGDARMLEAGFVLNDPIRARTDLVTIDASGRLHVVARIPHGVVADGSLAARIELSIDPSATWLVTNANKNAERRTHIAVRPLRGGPISLLAAPPGWRFENVGYGSISWESDDLFVAWIWKSGTSNAYARCSISLAACVLIDE